MDEETLRQIEETLDLLEPYQDVTEARERIQAIRERCMAGEAESVQRLSKDEMMLAQWDKCEDEVSTLKDRIQRVKEQAYWQDPSLSLEEQLVRKKVIKKLH